MEVALLIRPESPGLAEHLSAVDRGDLILRDRVLARLRGPRARELVARRLSQVVIEAFLIPGGHRLPHLQDALDEPIAAATEVALETLIDELADLVDLLPGVDPGAWEQARLRAELGLE
ncbi:MAG TPA: hypothetical protein VIB99_05560 [Candidatus Limnocylindrales bacterium]|jgi:hypothetical protein